jgi:chromosome segregation ATPase
MSQSEVKSNDPIQLKQTIIYLRAELNKYKNKYQHSPSSLLDDLQTENERLTNKYKELLHQNKKYEKRIHLYEQRIHSLEAQRKESLVALERLQGTEKDLRAANSQLSSIGNDQHLEVMKTIKRLEMKVETVLHQYIPSQNELSLAESKVSKLQLDLETARNVNAKQFELITILEEYILQLTKELSLS